MTIFRVYYFLILLLFSYAGQASTLKIATLAPDGTQWMKQMRAAAKQIKKETHQRVKVKFYPGGVMGNDKNILRKMRINQLQGGAVVANSLSLMEPDASIYSLPMLFYSYAEIDKIRKIFDTPLRKKIQNKGMVILGPIEAGFSYLMSRQPIHSNNDLKRLKVWLPENDKTLTTLYKISGISPVTLSIADVYTGLQTNLIEVIGSPPVAAIALQWHSKLHYITNIPYIYSYGYIVITQKAFKKLAEKDKSVVLNVFNEAIVKINKYSRNDNAKALSALQNQGLKLIELTASERQEMESIAIRTRHKLINDNIYTKSMYDKITEQLKAIRQ